MKTFQLLTLFFCLHLSVPASALVFEVVVESQTQKPKTSLYSSTVSSMQRTLPLTATMQAWRGALRRCESFHGTPVAPACLRSTDFEEVGVWGGRVGYQAYQGTAVVSLRCEVDGANLRAWEEAYYSVKYPVQNDCLESRKLL